MQQRCSWFLVVILVFSFLCARAEANELSLVDVQMRDGRVLRGTMTETAGGIALQQMDGVHRQIPRDQILSVAAAAPVPAVATVPMPVPAPMSVPAGAVPRATVPSPPPPSLPGVATWREPVPVRAVAPVTQADVQRSVQTAAAACDPCKPKSPWTFGGGFAFGLGQGNTDFFDLRVDGRIERERTPWGGKLKATYVYGEKESETITNNWRVLGRIERQLGQKSYAFGQVLYQRDTLSSLVYRWTFTVGMGWTVVDTKRDTLDLEAGVGATIEKRNNRDETVDPSGWLGADWEHQFGNGRALNVSYNFRPNFTDFDLSAQTLEIRYGMPCFGCVNLDVALRFDHVIDPGPGIEPLDVLFTVGLKFEM